jgi:hypothetical protein
MAIRYERNLMDHYLLNMRVPFCNHAQGITGRLRYGIIKVGNHNGADLASSKRACMIQGDGKLNGSGWKAILHGEVPRHT